MTLTAGPESGRDSLLRVYKTRRDTLLANSRHRFHDRLQPPIMWNIQGMRGQMSSNCLWHACKAFFLGVLIFSAGTAMCVAGFYIDGVLGDEEGANSSEADATQSSRLPAHYQTDPSRPQVRFSKLSFIGPVVMGIGGFIIVATCVMTFEARDSAAKVGPSFIKTGSLGVGVSRALPVAIPQIMTATMEAGSRPAPGPSQGAGRAATATPAGPGAYGRGRKRKAVEQRSVAVQTGEEDEEDGAEEAPEGRKEGGAGTARRGSISGALHNVKIDRKIILEAFRKFSRTLRTSGSVSSTGGEAEEQIQRYPSAPSLVTPKGGPEVVEEPDSKLSPFMAKSRPRISPSALRHTMSIDCPPPPPSPAPSPKGTAAATGAKAKRHERRQKFQRHVSVPIEQ